jgi:tryptophan-rich sensory protein
MLRGIAQQAKKPVVPVGDSAQAGPIAQMLVFVLFLIICLGTTGLGAAWTNLSIGDWYATLAKPSWNPPNWVFGPVWTALYVGMAVAAWLVWKRRGWDSIAPLLVFGVQLFLNAVWSGLFFGMRNPGFAFADIVLLWFAILATIVAFGRVSIPAALLLTPYLAWVTFATALNWSLWRLNS